MKAKTTIESANAKEARSVTRVVRPGWLAILLVWLAWLPALNAATITTDESDYSPFTVVSITGTGFQPGETVDNQIVQVAGPAPGTVYGPWTAQADTNGNFTTSWLVFSDDLLGTTLLLSSTGESSGLTASTTFTDAITCPGLQTGVAPISPPTGGFAIDGDVTANTPTSGVGDWLPGASGLGGVLTASGCPVNSLTTYHLIDAASSALDDNFSSGKADDDPNTWTWVLAPIGNKVDIKHAFIHAAKDGNGHTWVTIAATRQSNNGDAYVDFEFLQNPLAVVTNVDGLGGGFSSAGPNGGRTINDFVLAVTLTGGGTTPNLCVYRWNQVGVDKLGNPAFDYTNATSALPANSVFGAMNTAPISIPNCYSNAVDTYDVNQLGEVAVDVTALISGFDPCATASIGTILVKSKQSQAPNAQLGDFIVPQPIYQPFIIGPAAFAGPDQAKCAQGATTTFTLAGSVQPGSFTLSSTNWTVVSGNASIDHANSLTPTITITGTGSATLRLTVTDSGSCANSTQHDDVVLTVNPNPSVTVDNQVTCSGTPATIHATVSSGTAPFTYAWTVPTGVSDPGSVDHFNATVQGTYSVVVTDSKGCGSGSASGTLAVNPTPSVTVSSPTTCAGTPALIQASPSGGTGPYSYAWTVPAGVSDPGDVDHFNASVAGNYGVVVTDNNGCSSASASGTLTVNPTPSVTVNSPATCGGIAATIQASVIGGTSPYYYAWTVPTGVSDPGNVDHFNATVAGNYSVVVTDSKSCSSASGLGTLTVNPVPSVTVSSPTTCAGTPAVIQASASGGTGPYSYAWTVPAGVSDPGNVDHFNATVAGNYSVVVTDSKSCSSAIGSGTLTVNPIPSVTVNVPETCAGAAATIQALASGGTGPYTYAWTVPSGVSNPGSVDHFNATVAGNYSVVVTDSKGCNSASASGTLTVNPTPSVTVNSPATCAGIVAIMQATVTSGTAPFVYAWTVPSGVVNPGSVDHFNATVAGNYSVVVTDNKGCSSALASGTLTVNPVPSVTVSSLTTCAGTPGLIQASVSGGTGPYSYAWTVPTGVSNPGNVDHFNATVAGTYSVVVTDNKGCSSASASGTLTVNPVPSVTVNSPETCTGTATTIQAIASGGTGPYSYAWTVPTGVGNPGNTDHFNTTVAGTYGVVVTDGKGCSSASASGTLTVNSAPSVTVDNQTTCAGTPATIQANVTGGIGPFNYVWTVPAGVISPGSVDHFSATVPGTYGVMVTDSKGCGSTSASGTLRVNPTPSVTVNNPTICSGHQANVQASVTGGTSPYTYAWTVPAGVSDPGSAAQFSVTVAGTYSVVITDSKGCSSASASGTLTVNPTPSVTVNSTATCAGTPATIQATVTSGTAPFTYAWTVPTGVSNPGNTDHFNATVAGNYSVVVTDSKSCSSASGSGTLTVNPVPILNVNTTQPKCSTDTGSITASASGATAPYTYSLNGGAFQSSGTFDSLSGNSYTITAKDANGCTTSSTVSITVPSALVVTAAPTQPKCSGDTGSITAGASGGTSPYTYSLDGNNFQTSSTFSGLSANTYTVTAKDAHGCMATAAPVLVNAAPAPLAANAATLQPKCSTDTGSITVGCSGGCSPYKYSLNGTTFQTSGTFNGLQPNTYSVTVKDANGCTSAQTATIAQPLAVSCSLSGLSDVLLSTTGNTITAFASGGSPPYTFTWKCLNSAWTITGDTCNGQSSTMTYNAPAGNSSTPFSVTTTDANGCTAVCTLTVACLPPSFVTDSSLCTFTSPFRLIFTQDPTNMPCYKLTASNPGQFYYNMTYLGAPGQQTATFYITLPYPFVTQGAQPIHAYDSVGIQNSGGQTCLTPGNQLFVTNNQVTLASYGPNPVVGVTTYTFAETVPLSSLGYAYLNIHLDYGLKKAGGYAPGGTSGKDAVACSSSSAIPIPDLQADNMLYTFGYVVDNVTVNTLPGVQSANDFKKNPGTSGLVIKNSTLNPVSGASAVLKDGKGNVLGSGTTDSDGWYVINYKSTGKATSFNIILTPPGGKPQIQTITLKANGYAESDFVVP